MELLHHWCTSTSSTLTRSPELKILWRTEVPKIGLAHDYVLQTILALSSKHLARLKPEQRNMYEAAAVTLQKEGLDSVSKILPNITEDNCSAIFVFSGLTWMNSLAVLEKPKELPPHSQTETAADWLVMLRGIVSVTMTASSRLEKGELAAMVDMEKYSSTGENSAPHPADESLLRLKVLVTVSTVGAERSAMYCTVIDGLRRAFLIFHNLSSDTCFLPVVFSWPSLLPDDYVSRLGKREPEALVIFAYFAALLSKAESCWWLRGWGEHFISNILELLDLKYRVWIQWPLEELKTMTI
jgi:hypothetical protein